MHTTSGIQLVATPLLQEGTRPLGAPRLLSTWQRAGAASAVSLLEASSRLLGPETTP